MFNRKKAMMGVGVLLIFISTILTSAIAAGVLIRTSGTLQEKTVEVEKTTRERLTTGIEFYHVNAFANVTAGTITDIEIMTRLKPGSTPVGLGDTKITVTTNTEDFTYNFTSTAANATCNFLNITVESNYCLEDLFGNSNSIIEEEEVSYLRLALNITNSLKSNDNVKLQIIPKVGELESIDVRIPSIKTKKVQLY